jgi:RNA 2',3'-cyclic 3'-phosphodiesterase
VRLFLASPLPEDLQATLFLALTAARRAASQARWVRPGQLHLTVAFLGEQQAAQVPLLLEALRPLGVRHGPLLLGLQGAGCFGRPHAPNVLYANVTGDVAALRALVADARGALGGALPFAQPSATEPFVPHLTLARARGRPGDASLSRCARALRDRALGAFVLGRLVLYQSEPLPGGSRYTALADVPLGASAAAHP